MSSINRAARLARITVLMAISCFAIPPGLGAQQLKPGPFAILNVTSNLRKSGWRPGKPSFSPIPILL